MVDRWRASCFNYIIGKVYLCLHIFSELNVKTELIADTFRVMKAFNARLEAESFKDAVLLFCFLNRVWPFTSQCHSYWQYRTTECNLITGNHFRFSLPFPFLFRSHPTVSSPLFWILGSGKHANVVLSYYVIFFIYFWTCTNYCSDLYSTPLSPVQRMAMEHRVSKVWKACSRVSVDFSDLKRVSLFTWPQASGWFQQVPLYC